MKKLETKMGIFKQERWSLSSANVDVDHRGLSELRFAHMQYRLIESLQRDEAVSYELQLKEFLHEKNTRNNAVAQ